MIELRPYQRTAVDQCKVILRERNIAYLAAEVRTGKNFMSFFVAHELGWRNVCLITKKGAIEGVESDYAKVKHLIQLKITNFEQAHKLINLYDGFIIDEAHSLGAFPKPSARTKILKELIGPKPVLLMSGSPTPETPAQSYHQWWISPYSPFRAYTNFYKFAHQFIDIKKKFINGFPLNDYTHAKAEEIKKITDPYTVTVSQQDAEFTSFVEEEILTVKMDSRIYQLMKILKKDKVYTLKSGNVIVADTPVKLQSLCHQISSGTIKVNEDTRQVLDESKAWFIKTRFAGQKIGVLYKFIAEGELLKRIFPNWTDSPEEFNRREDLIFIRQVVSGREGVNLSTADALVMYNIDFSATSYWQARARMQTQTRTKASKLYWIFSEYGLEHFVYKAVSNKKNFTLDYFKKAVKEIGMFTFA